MKKHNVALALGLALALAGCARTAPIVNVAEAPVVTTQARAVQASQVRSAIITAGTSLGWRMADAGPGKLQGTLNLRAHTAVVDIPYTATTYGIVYNRSENLNHDGGRIHSNYNGWVQHLDRAIRTEISRL
jgi:hypothetical protein